MNTQTAIPPPRRLPPPAVLLNRPLLTDIGSVSFPLPPPDLTQAPLTLRATTVSLLLEEILTQTGYRHGGIND
jgi:hypothetical protein